MSRDWMTVIASLNPRERELLRGEQQVLVLYRMIQRHAVDWILCHDCQRVIERGECHMRDEISNLSLCLTCHQQLTYNATFSKSLSAYNIEQSRLMREASHEPAESDGGAFMGVDGSPTVNNSVDEPVAAVPMSIPDATGHSE